MMRKQTVSFLDARILVCFEFARCMTDCMREKKRNSIEYLVRAGLCACGLVISPEDETSLRLYVSEFVI